MIGRKRIYGGKPSSRRYKKTKRSFKKRSRRSVGNTSKSGTGSTFGFKSKRLSRRSWNHKLWDSTLQKQHVRSNLSSSFLTNSNVDPNLNIVTIARAVTPSFWTIGGGAQTYDPATPLPNYTGDIVIRGGTIGIKFVNEVADGNPFEVTCYLVRTGDQYDNSVTPNTVNHGWDPSLVPDFSTNVGKVVMRRQFLIENANTASVTYRLPIQKIDEAPFNVGKNQYVWFFLFNNNGASIQQLRTTTWHNLSFVGDST